MKETPNKKFPKKEKLTQHHLIARMFASTHPSLSVSPVRMVYFFIEDAKVSSLPQVLFLVSKRNIKSAVERNYVKRRMRESYRLNKSLILQKLLDAPNKSLVLMFIYTTKGLSDTQIIRDSFVKLLKKVEFTA